MKGTFPSAGLLVRRNLSRILSPQESFSCERGVTDQDLRFASQSYKHAFFLVKLLSDYRYRGPKHFDSHAYRTADRKDVIEFARGSMRTYKILEAKVHRFNRDRRIQALLGKIHRDDRRISRLTRHYSRANAKALLALNLDRTRLAKQPLPCEQLDQLVTELLLGAR